MKPSMISEENKTNEVSCNNCNAEFKITISDVVCVWRLGRPPYWEYYYFCPKCKAKVYLSLGKMQQLEKVPAFNEVKCQITCNNSACKSQVQLSPKDVSKIKIGFMRYSKEFVWKCPKCNQENYTHKSFFSEAFIERIINVLKRKG